jgi:DsbC/DsbD-like thiol-disulfide interchange protein
MSRTSPTDRVLDWTRTCLCVISALGLWAQSTPAGAAGPHSELALPSSAVADDARAGGVDIVRGSLLLDLDSRVKRAGVLLELEPGWHLYWKNPGEVGIATEIQWHAGETRVGPIEWPAPHAFEDSATGLTSYGYKNRVLLSSILGQIQGESRIAANVSLLVCRDECIPAELTLERSLSPPTPSPHASRERELFEHSLARVPRRAQAVGVGLEARYDQRILRAGDSFEASILLQGCNSIRRGRRDCPDAWPPVSARFFAESTVDEALEIEEQRLVPGTKRGAPSVLELKGRVADDLTTPVQRLAGVLELRAAGGESLAIAVDLPFPSPSWKAHSKVAGLVPVESEIAGSKLGMLRILLLALVGGILINGMPCVLPVLGIKICSAAELAQHDPRQLRLHGFAYAAGILSSMAALAGVVVLLRAAGTHVGWGFQFQEPLFVAAVASVVVLFAMNLFGVYEIAISSGGLDRI